MPEENDVSAIGRSQRRKSLSLVDRRLLFDVLAAVPLRVFAVGVMYASGYWMISPVWILLLWGLVKYRDRKRLEKLFNQEAAKAVALRNERLLVLTNVDPLPSWVFFTDIERCEWLNKAISHVWPSMQHFVQDKLKSLEPVLNQALSQFKKNSNFKFKKIEIGSLSPRVSGIKVFGEGHTLNRTVIDVYIFYFGDCAYNCSIMTNMSFGADKFEMKGCLRVIISRPVGSSLPGVEITFVRQPTVDFNLTGLFNIGDVPGLSKILRNTINGLVANAVVMPNKFTLNYDERIDFDVLKFPDPEGILKIDVVAARDLAGAKALTYSSKSNPDPYATITYGTKTLKTPSAKDTIDPVWNFTAQFTVDSFVDDGFTVTVEDEKKGKPLGRKTLSLKLIEDKPQFSSWIQLEDVVAGMVHLRVSYHALQANPDLQVSDDLPAILVVFIDDAISLPNTKDKIVVEVSVGNASQSSRSVSKDNPVFKEAFVFTVNNPIQGRIAIKIISEKTQKSFGNAELSVKQLIEAINMEIINEQVAIKGSDRTTLKVSMRLRTIKS